MPFIIAGDIALFEAVSAAEDATELADWLENQAQAKVDLHACTHLHAAVFQTLLAYRPSVIAASVDPFLSQWIMPYLTVSEDDEQ